MSNKIVNPQAAAKERWVKIIDEWELSGQTKNSFCRGRGLTTSAFYRWHAYFRPTQNPTNNKTKGAAFSKVTVKNDSPTTFIKMSPQKPEQTCHVVVKLPNELEVNISLEPDSSAVSCLIKQLMEV